jgi:type II restriction enzyme
VTEEWGKQNLYCAACTSNFISQSPCNTKAYDFSCDSCGARYQLKAGKGKINARVPDAGYEPMMEAIKSDRTPNLLVMRYTSDWSVSDLLLVPSFFFSPTAIEKRKPLGPNARRAGWIGCNIRLDRIAPEGKILLIRSSSVINPGEVRSQYARIRPFSRIPVSVRGWTLDVLRIVEALNLREFRLQDIYAHENTLSAYHPGNRNIRPKIRQQLQVLRDLRLISFRGHGRYAVT